MTISWDNVEYDTMDAPFSVTGRPLVVSDEAFEYLALHRGSLDHLRGDRLAWERAYHAGLRQSYESMHPWLPRRCEAILDVGAGLGGIDVYLYRHYGERPKIALLDGWNDPPKMKLHAQTFGHHQVALNFQQANGVPVSKLYYVAPDETRATSIGGYGLPRFDLVVSTGAWCFHFPPDEYLDWVLAHCNRGATIIVDMRQDRSEWWAQMKRLRVIGTAANMKKRARTVFQYA